MARSARSIRRAHHLRTIAARLATAAFLGAGLVACAGDGSNGLGPSSNVDLTAKTPTPPAPTPPPPIGTANLLSGATLWVDPSSSARRTADSWRSTRPSDAAQLDKLAGQPQARWFGNWNANVEADVNAATTLMTAAGAMPVFVAYNIPQRDCGGLSGGNRITPDGYRSWISAFANGIGSRRAAVILEPDALAAMDCLSAADQQLRVDLLRYAVETLSAKGSIAVYIDAGHAEWRSASTMASRLTSAGVAMAQGFSLNVSNFLTTSANVTYGQQIAALTGGKHFIVDTGRNGLGPTADRQWCNPAGRALGDRPTTQPGLAYVDAFLWIKSPGESDGACSGAPAAGTWMPEYALALAQRAAY
jgi:endoglucanase